MKEGKKKSLTGNLHCQVLHCGHHPRWTPLPVGTTLGVLKGAIGLEWKSDTFRKFKVPESDFVLFLTLTVSVVSITTTDTAFSPPVVWMFWIWSSQYRLESWVVTGLQCCITLLEKRQKAAHNYLAYVLYGVLSNWEYKSLYIKSK